MSYWTLGEEKNLKILWKLIKHSWWRDLEIILNHNIVAFKGSHQRNVKKGALRGTCVMLLLWFEYYQENWRNPCNSSKSWPDPIDQYIVNLLLHNNINNNSNSNKTAVIATVFLALRSSSAVMKVALSFGPCRRY